LIEGMVVVDGHVHSFQNRVTAHKVIDAFNKAYTIEFKNPGTSDIEDLLNKMELSSVDYSVLANFTTPKFLLNNNSWTLELCKNNKNLIPLVSFHPDLDNMEALFEKYINNGARGVKLHPMAQGFYPDNKKLYGVYKMCSELKLPVVFHCGRVANARRNEFSDISSITPILKKFKDMPTVLTHMVDGNVKDVHMVAESYENVYFDTSIVVTGYSEIRKTNKPSWLEDDMALEVFEKVGAHRITFGSDYPWGSMYHDVQRFKNMKIAKDKLRLIFGENALKLYNIKVTEMNKALVGV